LNKRVKKNSIGDIKNGYYWEKYLALSYAIKKIRDDATKQPGTTTRCIPFRSTPRNSASAAPQNQANCNAAKAA